jgi:D-apionolactonase
MLPMIDPRLFSSTTETPLVLRAGPLRALFEPNSANLRRICWINPETGQETEVWRGLYAAVRDHNWDTITPRVFNLKTDIQDDSFALTFDVECKSGDIDFLWNGELLGSKYGDIRCGFTGEARSNFKRNRIGFCLLHPPFCAGRKCQAIDPKYNLVEARFPDAIAPHQPFQNLRGFNHEFAPDHWAMATFLGDIFEMEDQRNWTDASFKTYCTPLDLPFPVEVKAGDKIGQTVILQIKTYSHSEGAPATEESPSAQEKPALPIITTTTKKHLSLPPLGLCVASHSAPLGENDIARLRLLNLSHLRADVRFEGDWKNKFSQAVREARALNTKLELALHLPDAPQKHLHELRAAIEKYEAPLACFLIFSDGEKVTTIDTAKAARELLKSLGVPLVGGTDFHFTEINRQHPPIEFLDGVCFSITPQVHAFDDWTLMENIETQATVIESARRFSGGLPIHISPVTLKPRGNPAATNGAPPPLPDERQRTNFGAAWTLGSLQTLASAGAASITFYETTGPRGVLNEDEIYPLFWVLAGVNKNA